MAETLRTQQESDAAAEPDLPRWYACYTKARHEKRAEQMIRERGIETYLPVIPRISQWKDRKKLVEWPLFPSYVFARIGLREAYRVLGVPGVASLVGSAGRPVPIADDELENVRLFVRALGNGDTPVDLVPFYAEGTWVEVTTGPFAGVKGVVVERRGRRRVLVGLKAIGQGMEVDLDVHVLRANPAPLEGQG
jgi:transcription termination/antitermination protein NusG